MQITVNEDFKKLISKIKFFYGIKQSDIAFGIGVKSTYLSDMINGRVPVTDSVTEKLYELYSDIKPKEVPENLVEKVESNRKTFDAVYDVQTIPIYDSTATLGLVEIFQGSETGNVINYISIPNLPKSDGAIFMTGDSMYPLLKSGDIVALKIINKLDIIYGEMYYVEYYGEDGDMEFKAIKYVKKSEKGNNHVQLASYNQHHEPKDILVSRIKTIAIVNASVRYNRL